MSTTTGDRINLLPSLDERDRALIGRAVEHLEHPSFAARISAVIGTPIEVAVELMPRKWRQRVQFASTTAVRRALNTAITGVRRKREVNEDHYHKMLVGFSGAAGGFFGLPGLLVELPITTTLMLRSIADIARSEGEDLADADTRKACLSVFALGSRTEQDDAAETGYYGVRAALTLSMSDLASRITTHGLESESVPAGARFVSAVATRFGIPVSRKAAAQAMPYLGAVTGAAINAVFVHHFQTVGRSHFVLRRLERKYGADIVKAEYERQRG